MLSGRMASPDKMFNPRSLEDYQKLNWEDITIFLEKKMISGQKKIEFLIPYLGKYLLIFQEDKIVIRR